MVEAAQIAPAYGLRDSRGPHHLIKKHNRAQCPKGYLDTTKNHTSERNVVVGDALVHRLGRLRPGRGALRGIGHRVCAAASPLRLRRRAAQQDHVLGHHFESRLFLPSLSS